MRSNALTLISVLILSLGCEPKVASISLESLPPTKLYTDSKIDLPLAHAVDKSGQRIANSKIEVKLSPPGLATVEGGKLVPFNSGMLEIEWQTGDVSLKRQVQLALIDKVVIECGGSCQADATDKIKLFVKTLAGEKQVVVDAPEITTQAKKIVVEKNVVRVRNPSFFNGTQTFDVNVEVFGLKATKEVTFAGLPDDLELRCMSAFTPSTDSSGKQGFICHAIQRQNTKIIATVKRDGQRVREHGASYKVMDSRVLKNSGLGSFLGRQIGTTSVKAIFKKSGLSKELAVVVHGASPKRRILGAPVKRRSYSRYRRGYKRSKYSRSGYSSTEQKCPDQGKFQVQAYAYADKAETAQSIFCLNREAVACLADEISQWRNRGDVDEEMIGDLAPPCCCIEQNRRQLLNEEKDGE